MLTNPGTFDVEKIVDYGINDKDGKESVFLRFATASGEFTWFGSLKSLQPGKEKSARQITFETMSRLGWDGDIDKFVNQSASFNLPEGVRIEVADDEYAPGKKVIGKVIKVLVPGFGMKKMDQGKAKVFLSGFKADIAKAQAEAATHQEEPPF